MTNKLPPAIKGLSRDIAKSHAKSIGRGEVRALLNRYYQSQEDRKRAEGQIRALAGANEPHDLLIILSATDIEIEKTIKDVLDLWTDEHPVSRWAKSIYGIGPIISAGLEARVDITQCPSAGSLWSYAGLCPGQKKERGKKAKWNPELKTLAWNIGEVFQKCSPEKSFYRQLYDKRKAYEQAKNDALEYKDQARHALETKTWDKSKLAYKEYSIGRLPPAHINERVKRYVAKMFMSQWHEVAYRHHYDRDPPAPYIFAKDPENHIHLITPEMVF